MLIVLIHKFLIVGLDLLADCFLGLASWYSKEICDSIFQTFGVSAVAYQTSVVGLELNQIICVVPKPQVRLFFILAVEKSECVFGQLVGGI